jgi:predicted RNase H-related nuclease YkuK (DUF458 family)
MSILGVIGESPDKKKSGSKPGFSIQQDSYLGKDRTRFVVATSGIFVFLRRKSGASIFMVPRIS